MKQMLAATFVLLCASGSVWAQPLPSQAELQREIHKYEQLTSHDPRDVESWHILGGLYREAEQWDKAIAAETRAIQGHPKYAVAYYGRGKARVARAGTLSDDRAAEDYGKAVEDFTSSVRLFEGGRGPGSFLQASQPNLEYVDSYRTRGVALAHLNKYPEGIGDLSTAIQVLQHAQHEAWDDAKLLYERGYLEEKAGRKKEAVVDYHRAGMLYADAFNAYGYRAAYSPAQECVARLDTLGATAEGNEVRLKLIPKTPKTDLPK
jgi:tetratricopeptide (TPR) repeat protein